MTRSGPGFPAPGWIGASPPDRSPSIARSSAPPPTSTMNASRSRSTAFLKRCARSTDCVTPATTSPEPLTCSRASGSAPSGTSNAASAPADASLEEARRCAAEAGLSCSRAPRTISGRSIRHGAHRGGAARAPRAEPVAPRRRPPRAADRLRAGSPFAKLLYRSGDRDGAMEALENALAHPLFPELSALVRGILMRERGIVHTFCEHPVAARADLQEALRLFKSVGYKPGMVRATTPGALAPLHRCAGGRGRPQLRAQHPPRALRRPRRARDEGRDGRPRVEARRPLLRPR